MALSFYWENINKSGEELLKHGTTLFPIGCYYDDLVKYPVPWHWHEELEAVIMKEGFMEVGVGNEKHILGPGEGYILNARVLHMNRSAGKGPCLSYSICMHPRLVGGSRDSVFWQNYIQPMLEDDSFQFICLSREIPWQTEAMDILERVWKDCVEEPEGFELLVRNRLSELILLLKRNRPTVKIRVSEKALRDEGRMKKMLSFIQEHYGEELDVNQIAESALISASECLRCFRSTIGISPMQYVIEFRIQKAVELLTNTQDKITEIGLRCGFQEMSYFAKIFRKLKGCTPTEYRRKLEASVSEDMKDKSCP